jgi:hypothetical protein
MKITFDDKGYDYIEIIRDPKDLAKIIITISARDAANPLKTVVNSVDMTVAEFLQLSSDLDLF